MIAHLPGRAVLLVGGEDRVSFLQGLVSNDVAQAGPGRAVWAALLSPQGKWLADFFILSDGERLLLDCEAAQATDLARRLSRFRLRARVSVEPSGLSVFAAWGAPADAPGALAAPDPRLPDAGWRILGESVPTDADADAYDAHRLRLGLPDGSRDLEPDRTVLLEANFDVLNGVSWSKGCYMGQELTARTHYRGLVKRRLIPVRWDGGTPPEGTAVMLDGQEVGTMRSGRDGSGLATLRIAAVHRQGLRAGETTLSPHLPEWLTLPEPAAAG